MKSRHARFAEGDIVRSRNGFREAFVSDGKGIAKLDADPSLPLTAYMSVLGNPGLTAYGGLTAVANLQKGDKLFVSTAAGAVGSIAVQIGKLFDCYVIGSTGSEEKAAWLRDDLKLDAVINYKTAQQAAALRTMHDAVAGRGHTTSRCGRVQQRQRLRNGRGRGPAPGRAAGSRQRSGRDSA